MHLRHIRALNSNRSSDPPLSPMPDTIATQIIRPDSASINAGYCTSLFDSVAADTVQGRIPHFVPTAVADSLRHEKAVADSIAAIPPPGRESGIYGSARGGEYSHSTALNCLLAAMLFLLLVKGSSVFRALRTYRNELWSIRRRGNVFDDQSAVSLPMAGFLALVYIIFGGVLLYNFPCLLTAPSLAGAMKAMGVLAGFYIFERTAVWVLGSIFAQPDDKRRLMGGFSATRAFAGLGFIIPALLMLFEPQWHKSLLIVSLIVYLAARLMFIIKGFRIFYDGLLSLFYFILYLCTLEIIPLIILYGYASGILQISLY